MLELIHRITLYQRRKSSLFQHPPPFISDRPPSPAAARATCTTDPIQYGAEELETKESVHLNGIWELFFSRRTWKTIFFKKYLSAARFHGAMTQQKTLFLKRNFSFRAQGKEDYAQRALDDATLLKTESWVSPPQLTTIKHLKTQRQG